jgi:hypothetical protein
MHHTHNLIHTTVHVASLVPHGWCKAIEVSGYGWSGGRGLARGPLLKGEIGVRAGDDRHPINTIDGRSLTSRRSNGADARQARIPLVRQAGARPAGGRSIPMLVDSSAGQGEIIFGTEHCWVALHHEGAVPSGTDR